MIPEMCGCITLLFKYAQHAAALALTDYVCVCACVRVQKASEVKWKIYPLQTCIHLSLYLESRWGMINGIDYGDDVKWQRIFSVRENKKKHWENLVMDVGLNKQLAIHKTKSISEFLCALLHQEKPDVHGKKRWTLRVLPNGAKINTAWVRSINNPSSWRQGYSEV